MNGKISNANVTNEENCLIQDLNSESERTYEKMIGKKRQSSRIKVKFTKKSINFYFKIKNNFYANLIFSPPSHPTCRNKIQR